MIYKIADQTRRIDINVNHISQVYRLKNVTALADNVTEIEMIGDLKYKFTGQEAKDVWQDWVNIMLPALGGLLN